MGESGSRLREAKDSTESAVKRFFKQLKRHLHQRDNMRQQIKFGTAAFLVKIRRNYFLVRVGDQCVVE